MTGMSQLTAKINENNMDALDTEYVEVTWHSGARPSHQVWQGKIYYWGREKSAESVDKSSGSGIIEGRKPLKIDMQYFAEKDIEKQESTSLKRAMRKYQKRIEEHEDKIKNPEKYISD